MSIPGFEELANLVEGRTLIGRERLRVLYHAAIRAHELGGAIAELGVYKGGSALLMHLAAPHVPIHLFDTFDGMPDPGEHLEVHKEGDFSDTSFGLVRSWILEHSPRPDNVHFHPGLFPQTFWGDVLDQSLFGLVHLDGDYYSTTHSGLHTFYPRMVFEGRIVLDDYGWERCPGVKQAIYEFLLDKEEIVETTTGTSYQAFIQKM